MPDIFSAFSPAQKLLLELYADAVVKAPPSLHLTSAYDRDEFLQRHVLDAVALVQSLDFPAKSSRLRVMDVGSGNGVPGIPIAICQPEWIVVLLDSDNKKCGFVDMFCKSNAINNVRVIASRAEIAAKEENREKYDLVFARALSKLPSAIELAGPFVKLGGHMIVPHGTSWQEELEKSKEAQKEIGLKFLEAKAYKIPNGIEFNALLFKKDHETPERYPRAIGMSQKRPL